MTPVVIDASAGVELIANTVCGRLIRRLLPRDAVPWVPDHFFAECGAVLRRWDLSRRLAAEEPAGAIAELSPGRCGSWSCAVSSRTRGRCDTA